MTKAVPWGFTLTEVLLSVALISILAALAVPLYQSFEQKNELDLAVLTLAGLTRRAQLLSQSVANDSAWGIKIQTSSLVIFKGSTFVLRDPNFDENTELGGTVGATGTLEVVFSRLYGFPEPTGTIVFTNANQDSKTVSINAKGTLIY